MLLPIALTNLAAVRIVTGDLDAAAALLEEADALAEATGNAPIVMGGVLLAAYRGDEVRALVLIKASESAAIARGEGVALTFNEHAAAVLHNGLGQYDVALLAAQSASGRDELMASVWSLPELVEATTRCGRIELAAAALERLSETTRAAGTELALGIEARSRALLSNRETAECHYREAIERLGRTRVRVALARAHLLYGEWLRREGRRVDCREQLRTAHRMFIDMGTEAFAERAARELLATGEKVRKRAAESLYELTAHEAQIARLAAEGQTNAEIGAQLFLSPRTVEWHMRKVFMKLGVRKRRELRDALPRSDPAA
jgi:DNA-binding CsgD family transcriptional regulator